MNAPYPINRFTTPLRGSMKYIHPDSGDVPRDVSSGFTKILAFPCPDTLPAWVRSSGNRTFFPSFFGKNPADQPQTFKPILSHQLSDTSWLPTGCSAWFLMPEPESENDDDPHDRVHTDIPFTHEGFL